MNMTRDAARDAVMRAMDAQIRAQNASERMMILTKVSEIGHVSYDCKNDNNCDSDYSSDNSVSDSDDDGSDDGDGA